MTNDQMVIIVATNNGKTEKGCTFQHIQWMEMSRKNKTKPKDANFLIKR